MASFGVQVRVSGPRGSFERWYERPPVFVGRRPASDCLLDTQGVSKTHACIDLRASAICIRDCGSANGTLVGGAVAEPHRWTRAGAIGEVVEVRISEWTLHITALPVADVPANAGTRTLTEMLEAPRLGLTPGAGVRPPPAHAHTVVLGEQGAKAFPPARAVEAVLASLPAQAPAPTPVPLPLDPLHAELLRVQRALYEAAAHMLATAPPPHQRALCDQLAASYPVMGKDQSFVALLRHYGWSPPHDAPLASSALERMQELVRWYLGPDRSITNEAELTAFKEHQRRALDELLIGFVKLVSGLEKFEQQMALRQDVGAGGNQARSPAELIRQLLDWRLPAEDALQHVRASFADLMMHQVALLHGVMRGVKALLTELSPSTIEAAARERKKKSLLSFGGPDAWDVYKERHADFSDEENERFRVLFGADFAEEYRLLTRDARASEVAAPAEPPAARVHPSGVRGPSQAGGRRD